MRANRSRLRLAALLVAVVLSTCVSCATAYIDKYSGTVSSGGEQTAGPDDGAEDFYAPTLYWSDDGRTFLLVTWASSSCPAEPTRIEARPDNVIDIELKQGGAVCTADFEPTTYELAIPSGIATDNDVELWIDGTFTSVLPAFT